MAEYLGVRQATVSRLESGQPESGPVMRLLDLLEAEPASPEPAAPRAAEPGIALSAADFVGPSSSLPSVPDRRASQPNTDHPRGSEGPCPEAGAVPASGPFLSQPECV